jgi:Transposase
MGTSERLANRDRWQGLIERQAESGLSVRAFCRQESLREPSFYAWRRKLAQREGKDMAEPTFIAAQVVDHIAPAIVLQLASGNRLELSATLPTAQVAELVWRLEQRVSS